MEIIFVTLTVTALSVIWYFIGRIDGYKEGRRVANRAWRNHILATGKYNPTNGDIILPAPLPRKEVDNEQL